MHVLDDFKNISIKVFQGPKQWGYNCVLFINIILKNTELFKKNYRF